MPLTVLSVAYPFAPVGPGCVGGAERVLADLDAALHAAGHCSLVIACAGSRTRGLLIPVPRWDGMISEPVRTHLHARVREAVAWALDRWPVDVVHLHGRDFAAYLPPPGPPALATLHLPLAWYPAEVLAPRRPATYLHCVSASQRRLAPAGLSLLPDIPNGVDLERLRPGGRKRRFALALGRICPEKGFHHALDAAARARVPLLLGGQVFPYLEHQAYFRAEVRPRLGPGRRFLGPLDERARERLLSAARCLVVPSQAPETSSLVAREALACGTPVVAFPAGALAEVVEHGRTGFLVDDVDAMAEALGRAGDLDPQACRQAAEERFCGRRMAAAYLDLYARLAGGGSALSGDAPGAPACLRGGRLVPEAGVEPACPRGAADFESAASAIPPLRRARES